MKPITLDTKTGVFTINDVQLGPETTINDLREKFNINIFLSSENKNNYCCRIKNELVNDGMILEYAFFNLDNGKLSGFVLSPASLDKNDEYNKETTPTSKFISQVFGNPQYADNYGYKFVYKWGTASIPFVTPLCEEVKPCIFVEYEK